MTGFRAQGLFVLLVVVALLRLSYAADDDAMAELDGAQDDKGRLSDTLLMKAALAPAGEPVHGIVPSSVAQHDDIEEEASGSSNVDCVGAWAISGDCSCAGVQSQKFTISTAQKGQGQKCATADGATQTVSCTTATNPTSCNCVGPVWTTTTKCNCAGYSVQTFSVTTAKQALGTCESTPGTTRTVLCGCTGGPTASCLICPTGQRGISPTPTCANAASCASSECCQVIPADSPSAAVITVSLAVPCTLYSTPEQFKAYLIAQAAKATPPVIVTADQIDIIEFRCASLVVVFRIKSSSTAAANQLLYQVSSVIATGAMGPVASMSVSATPPSAAEVASLAATGSSTDAAANGGVATTSTSTYYYGPSTVVGPASSSNPALFALLVLLIIPLAIILGIAVWCCMRKKPVKCCPPAFACTEPFYTPAQCPQQNLFVDAYGPAGTPICTPETCAP